MSGRIRVYSAISLDGFLAGEGDDLSWMGVPDPDAILDEGVLDFEGFMSQVGVLLMGRRTYDVVRAMDVPWPYGDLPVLVATHRPLDEDRPPTVRRVRGSIDILCLMAQEVAGEADVYLDGGALISQALEARLVDELVLTLVPTLLGRGVPLFAGDRHQHLRILHQGRYGRMLQLVLSPR